MTDTPQHEHPTVDIDDVVHQRHRLGILTIAAEARRVEFGYLREALSLTAGNLSRHITVLDEAGLIEVQKGYDGKRPKTWISINEIGRTALDKEMNALRALVTRQDQPQPAGEQQES